MKEKINDRSWNQLFTLKFWTSKGRWNFEMEPDLSFSTASIQGISSTSLKPLHACIHVLDAWVNWYLKMLG